jgi:hypothetical protein
MPSFEQMGRKLDRELERLRNAAENKVKPTTRRQAEKALRSVSASLSRLAAQIEATANRWAASKETPKQ